MDQQVERQQRICVDIPVMITTVLDAFEATLVDMTEEGALLSGCSLIEGTRFQIDYMGETVYAQSVWREVDRTGVRFIFRLNDGPLYQRLTIARAGQLAGSTGFTGAGAATPRGFGRRIA